MGFEYIIDFIYIYIFFVFFVWNVIWILVFLKRFVKFLIIGLWHVKVTHFLGLEGLLLCECGKDII